LGFNHCPADLAQLHIEKSSTVTDFINSIGPFAYGFVLGFFWHPIWQILKKIWHEAKLARTEWSKPNGKSD